MPHEWVVRYSSQHSIDPMKLFALCPPLSSIYLYSWFQFLMPESPPTLNSDIAEACY